MWNVLYYNYRGKDVKNLPTPYKVTIPSPFYFNLRRDGIDDAGVSSVPLFFRKAIL